MRPTGTKAQKAVKTRRQRPNPTCHLAQIKQHQQTNTKQTQEISTTIFFLKTINWVPTNSQPPNPLLPLETFQPSDLDEGGGLVKGRGLDKGRCYYRMTYLGGIKTLLVPFATQSLRKKRIIPEQKRKSGTIWKNL